MGRAVCAAVEAAADLELGPRVDVGDDVEAVADADVAVVFSTPDVAVDHVLALRPARRARRRGDHRLDAGAARPGAGALARGPAPGSASSWHRTSRSARSC